MSPRGPVILLALAVALAVATSLSSCSSEEPPPTGRKVIDISFQGDEVTPNGDRLQIAVGQPVTLHVTADKAGAMHVHANPARDLSYDRGTTDIDLVIARPGVVEIESHALNRTIVQLEVR